MPLTFVNLRDQIADYDDLRPAMLMAADDVWAEHGFDAACVFLLGA